jgi:hypothetical protein
VADDLTIANAREALARITLRFRSHDGTSHIVDDDRAFTDFGRRCHTRGYP